MRNKLAIRNHRREKPAESGRFGRGLPEGQDKVGTEEIPLFPHCSFIVS